MKRQWLSVVGSIVLALLTAGPSRANDWLSTLQPDGSGEDVTELADNPICAAQGKNCGLIDDGQGGKVDCGTCTGYNTCGGSGIPNVCGCTPTGTCGNRECGSVDRGCGLGSLSCGQCPSSKTCRNGFCVLPPPPPPECPCGGRWPACEMCAERSTELADNPICAAQGKNCGLIDDGQGGQVDCGPCVSPNTCGGSGIPNICGCAPKNCTGLNCGTIDRGCNLGTLSCGGPCPGFDTCGGGGTPNVCGCTPKNCDGRVCGVIDRGCGLGLLDCGMCSAAFDTCGGGGIPGVCGCTPKTCGTKNCGTIDQGCGLGTISCGQCSGGGICRDGSCCKPATCGARECGSIEQGCGLGRVSCGSCPSGHTCRNGFCEPLGDPDPGDCPCGGRRPACRICTDLTAQPTASPYCAARGKNCGVIDDGHGGKVDCGTCTGKDTCGGGGVPNVCGHPDTK